MTRINHPVAILTTFHRRGPDMLRAVWRYRAVAKRLLPCFTASATAVDRSSPPAESDYTPASRPTWISRPRPV